MEGLICVSKLIGLALWLELNLPFFLFFYFVFEGNFPSTSPRRAYIWRGDLTEGFLRYRFGRLIRLFPERLSGKVHPTILKGIVGGFEFSFSQRNLKELARKAMEMCFEC